MPTLSSWSLETEGEDHIAEVWLEFSDGTRRWCYLATPSSLHKLLEDRTEEPGLWCRHMLIVRSLSDSDVGRVLAAIDADGELLEASLREDTDVEHPGPET